MSLSSSTVGGRTKYKIVLLGDQQVGKTSIIERFINNRFEDSYNVPLNSWRQPSALTFLSKISSIKISHIDCSCGTLLDSSDFAASFQAISKIPISVSWFMICQILPHWIVCSNGWSSMICIENMLLFLLLWATSVTLLVGISAFM